jgi:hypothetical protein
VYYDFQTFFLVCKEYYALYYDQYKCTMILKRFSLFVKTTMLGTMISMICTMIFESLNSFLK